MLDLFNQISRCWRKNNCYFLLFALPSMQIQVVQDINFTSLTAVMVTQINAENQQKPRSFTLNSTWGQPMRRSQSPFTWKDGRPWQRSCSQKAPARPRLNKFQARIRSETNVKPWCKGETHRKDSNTCKNPMFSQENLRIACLKSFGTPFQPWQTTMPQCLYSSCWPFTLRLCFSKCCLEGCLPRMDLCEEFFKKVLTLSCTCFFVGDLGEFCRLLPALRVFIRLFSRQGGKLC